MRSVCSALFNYRLIITRLVSIIKSLMPFLVHIKEYTFFSIKSKTSGLQILQEKQTDGICHVIIPNHEVDLTSSLVLSSFVSFITAYVTLSWPLIVCNPACHRNNFDVDMERSPV